VACGCDLSGSHRLWQHYDAMCPESALLGQSDKCDPGHAYGVVAGQNVLGVAPLFSVLLRPAQSCSARLQSLRSAAASDTPSGETYVRRAGARESGCTSKVMPSTAGTVEGIQAGLSQPRSKEFPCLQRLQAASLTLTAPRGNLGSHGAKQHGL
jgi:hypothetical protein